MRGDQDLFFRSLSVLHEKLDLGEARFNKYFQELLFDSGLLNRADVDGVNWVFIAGFGRVR